LADWPGIGGHSAIFAAISNVFLRESNRVVVEAPTEEPVIVTPDRAVLINVIDTQKNEIRRLRGDLTHGKLAIEAVKILDKIVADQARKIAEQEETIAKLNARIENDDEEAVERGD